MAKKNQTMKIALCGITAGLCIVVLMMGYMFPFATYACPAIAAVFIFPVAYEYKEKTAFTLYAAVSFLAIFLIPDYELSFMFIFVFGLYTVFKLRFDRIKKKPLRLLVKFIFINVTVIAVYRILLVIFPVQALINEFAEYSIPFMILLMAMMNATFFLYDKALEKLLIIYVKKLRKKLFRNG